MFLLLRLFVGKIRLEIRFFIFCSFWRLAPLLSASGAGQARNDVLIVAGSAFETTLFVLYRQTLFRQMSFPFVYLKDSSASMAVRSVFETLVFYLVWTVIKIVVFFSIYLFVFLSQLEHCIGYNFFLSFILLVEQGLKTGTISLSLKV
jgi:hypothetical protein